MLVRKLMFVDFRFPPVLNLNQQEMILTGPLSSSNIVSLVKVSSCSNTGSTRDDPYLTFLKQSK